MNDQVLNTLIIAFGIALAVVLLRVVGSLWQPSDESPSVKLMGIFSPLLTWLKYRRIPRMV